MMLKPRHLTAVLLGTCCIGLWSAAAPVRALQIQLEMSTEFERHPAAVQALQQAARAWEDLLLDPVTVSIRAEFAGPPNIDPLALAATTHEFANFEYPRILAALQQDATSADDRLAVAHLPAGPALAFQSRTPDGQPIFEEGDRIIHRYVHVASACARAAGLDPGLPAGTPDGLIQFNDAWRTAELFDFDPADGTDGIDFTTLALHEMGHVLGFNSGVDLVDLTTLPAGPLAPMDLTGFSVITPLDLYRFSSQSTTRMDLSPGGEPYFSIDGGSSPLAQFATGQYNGDGHQAGHWKPGLGLMDAQQADGTRAGVTRLDLRALDVIGWDLAVFACGDLDGDDDVDAGDLATFLVHWTGPLADGAPGISFFQGDCDGDQDVDAADLSHMLRNWTGYNGRTRSALSVVPEPQSMLPALLGGTLLLPWRRALWRTRRLRL